MLGQEAGPRRRAGLRPLSRSPALQIDSYERLYEEVSGCENSKVFHCWLQCDCRPFKQALLSTIRRWGFMFKRHLSDHVINRWAPGAHGPPPQGTRQARFRGAAGGPAGRPVAPASGGEEEAGEKCHRLRRNALCCVRLFMEQAQCLQPGGGGPAAAGLEAAVRALRRTGPGTGEPA